MDWSHRYLGSKITYFRQNTILQNWEFNQPNAGQLSMLKWLLNRFYQINCSIFNLKTSSFKYDIFLSLDISLGQILITVNFVNFVGELLNNKVLKRLLIKKLPENADPVEPWATWPTEKDIIQCYRMVFWHRSLSFIEKMPKI